LEPSYVSYFARNDWALAPSHCLMPTYELPYAKEHLFELFNNARAGEEVIIVRADGRSCELTPLAEVKQEETIAIASTIPDDAPSEGELVPA
jgi:antitoxin (DNA-binding transcriptional repressor) of toxin-antitoxin stability system